MASAKKTLIDRQMMLWDFTDKLEANDIAHKHSVPREAPKKRAYRVHRCRWDGCWIHSCGCSVGNCQ